MSTATAILTAAVVFLFAVIIFIVVKQLRKPRRDEECPEPEYDTELRDNLRKSTIRFEEINVQYGQEVDKLKEIQRRAFRHMVEAEIVAQYPGRRRDDRHQPEEPT